MSTSLQTTNYMTNYTPNTTINDDTKELDEVDGELSSLDYVRSQVTPARLREKTEIANLNDRLLNYIENVRKLKSENVVLQSVAQSYLTNVIQDANDIKQLYEDQLNDAKRQIGDLNQRSTKQELDFVKTRAQLDELASKEDKREQELKAIEARLKDSEREARELRSRNNTLDDELNTRNDELKKLKPMLNDFEKQIKELKRQMELEVLARADLENRNKALRDDLKFNKEVYDKELNRIKTAKMLEIDVVDSKLRDEYDSRLSTELQRMRNDTEEAMKALKDDVEKKYQAKLAEQSIALSSSQVDSALRDEIKSYAGRVKDLQGEKEAIQAKANNNEKKIRELENLLSKSNERYEEDVYKKNTEILNSRKEVQDLMKEYQELYNLKIVFDEEIGAYGKLLDSEENRLSPYTLKSSELVDKLNEKLKLEHMTAFSRPVSDINPGLPNVDLVAQTSRLIENPIPKFKIIEAVDDLNKIYKVDSSKKAAKASSNGISKKSKHQQQKQQQPQKFEEYVEQVIEPPLSTLAFDIDIVQSTPKETTTTNNNGNSNNKPKRSHSFWKKLTK